MVRNAVHNANLNALTVALRQIFDNGRGQRSHAFPLEMTPAWRPRSSNVQTGGRGAPQYLAVHCVSCLVSSITFPFIRIRFGNRLRNSVRTAVLWRRCRWPDQMDTEKENSILFERMNGKLQQRRTLFLRKLRNSNGILTDERNSYAFLKRSTEIRMNGWTDT